MKIVKVETYPLFYPLSSPYGDANGLKKYRSCYVIKVITQSGYYGWGEVNDWLPAVDLLFRQRIIPYLIGKKANEHNAIVQVIHRWNKRCAAGVSMALTEILAQASGCNVTSLWGGVLRNEIPLYASFQSYCESIDWIDRSYRQVKKAIEAGFTIVKVKVGGKTLEEDAVHIRTLLAKLDCSIKWIIDANQSYDLASAKWWEQVFVDFPQFLWFEEPLPLTQVRYYRELHNHLSVAIAGGEDVTSSEQFISLLQEEAFDIIQPDVGHISSVFDYLHCLRLGRSFGVRTSSHSFDGAISRLYTIFAHACLPPWSKMKNENLEPIEWDMMDNPFSQLVSIKINEGNAVVPNGIGLGCEIDIDILKKFRWDGTSY